jgi:uncharacterized protein
MDASTGTRETYSFDVPLEYDGINLTSNTSGKVEIMKVEEGFNARIENLKVMVECVCDRCLKKINEEIVIESAERLYLMTAPDEEGQKSDANDLYLVHKKDQTIDLGEFLRQEIILHFPLIPVCSKSCKGLCPICGNDRNKKMCDCKPEIIEEYKPLSALKDLLK